MECIKGSPILRERIKDFYISCAAFVRLSQELDRFHVKRRFFHFNSEIELSLGAFQPFYGFEGSKLDLDEFAERFLREH